MSSDQTQASASSTSSASKRSLTTASTSNAKQRRTATPSETEIASLSLQEVANASMSASNSSSPSPHQEQSALMLASLVNQAIARLRNECEPWPNVSSMEQAKLLYSSTMDDWAAENVDELLFLAVDFSTVDDRHLRMVRELVDRAPKLRLLQFCGTSGVPAEFLHDLLNAHNGLVVDISPLLDMAEVAIAKLTSRIFERVLVLDMLVTHSDQAVEMLRNWFGPDDCMALALTQLQTARFRQTAVSHLW